ncbi:hypothetical protein JMJ35_003509 [Cladonia borealis]|uniref:VIT domain-containing protein n=1 Tax=Cladonia borealis TaxID=184061 RepID=A0AA39R2M7_9LECA|nr:hypothetical protein JMJ35_003509 [Cladonia borealis]
MPPEILPSNMPFESACYSITTNGLRKLQQQRLSVLTTVKRTAATTTIVQIFYNPYCKSIDDFLFTFPQNCGTKLKKVHCEIGTLAWNVPEESSAFPHNRLRLYRLRSTIQPKQKIMVRTIIEDKVQYYPQTKVYAWNLPKVMAPPYNSSLPLVYDEISLDVMVDLGAAWKISAIGSPSHGTVASNGGWRQMMKDGRADHKAFALFRAKDPRLKKDIVFIFKAKHTLALDRGNRGKASDVNRPKASSEKESHGRIISQDGDPNESTRHQTSHSHESKSSRNPRLAADRLTPYSPPSTLESNLTRTSAPSPESSDSDILHNNVCCLLALQHPGDCFSGLKTGFWTLHRALPEILSISDSTLDSHPDQTKSRVWVTIVVIAWFNAMAPDHVYLWLEYVRRARKWLELVRATGAVKFAGWETKATDIFASDEDMDD